MPLNVRRFGVSFFILILFSSVVFSQSDVVKQKLSRARSFVAARNYTAAAIELEDLRRAVNDESMQNIANVMLMQVYLETPDYRRAQMLLSEIFEGQKKTKSGLSNSYFAVAGQVIRSSKNQGERYKQLGLSITDRNLPSEAVADLESMRAMLEAVAEQAKTLSSVKKASPETLGLLEDATTARSNLARDEYDAARWRNATADTRESIVGSQSKVFEVDGTTTETPSNGDSTRNVPTNPSSSNAVFTKPNGTPSSTPVPVKPKVVSEPPAKLVAENVTPQTNNSPPVVKIDKPKNVDPPKTVEKQVEKTVALKPDVPKTEPKIETAKSEPKFEPAKNEPRIEKTSEIQTPEVVKEPTSPNVNQVAQGGNPTTDDSDLPPTAVKKEVVNPPTETITKPEPVANNDVTLAVGATLLDYATQRVAPSYPQLAKNIGVKGAVTVEVLIDEQGRVASIQKTTGPELLKRAAVDAIKKWKFRPILKDGLPVKFTGFVNFNFAQ